MFYYYFPKGQQEESEFFFLSRDPDYIHRHARTHLGGEPATRITQASLLNCDGSGIVLAIGSVLLLYSKGFAFSLLNNV